ncbi:hypothetical protein CFOL_v3_30299 [Cephalotus follicularis]|uniref:Uncharacterized protein n=1 Tax=Cephalotus follicularis TaxID=3775 RepID=A0A1Q3D3J6_CEPFO|nr:hypothetical protein CFOL_v3_30299 [Cephalotus follicularis]
MADLLKRAERYVNAEEEMLARKQKAPWTGQQEERREHSRNAPERREKRKERSDLTKGDLRHKLSRREGTSRGERQYHLTIRLPLSWTHAQKYSQWNRIKSLFSGQRR